MKIAITGKGGTGKTTLSALLGYSFSSDGKKVFLIDADPDGNLMYRNFNIMSFFYH